MIVGLSTNEKAVKRQSTFNKSFLGEYNYNYFSNGIKIPCKEAGEENESLFSPAICSFLMPLPITSVKRPYTKFLDSPILSW